mgnify:CR=1 FL=1
MLVLPDLSLFLAFMYLFVLSRLSMFFNSHLFLLKAAHLYFLRRLGPLLIPKPLLETLDVMLRWSHLLWLPVLRSRISGEDLWHLRLLNEPMSVLDQQGLILGVARPHLHSS